MSNDDSELKVLSEAIVTLRSEGYGDLASDLAGVKASRGSIPRRIMRAVTAALTLTLAVGIAVAGTGAFFWYVSEGSFVRALATLVYVLALYLIFGLLANFAQGARDWFAQQAEEMEADLNDE